LFLAQVLLFQDDALSGLEPGLQDARRYRLADEVVSPAAEHGSQIVFVIQNGQHDDVQLPPLGQGAQAADQLQAVHFRHGQIGNHQLRLLFSTSSNASWPLAATST
jgi:hypothetical protein